MIEVRFANEPLAQYRVYSLCCQKLLDFYEELSEVCDIDTLVDEFDEELRDSYCGDKYGLAIETVIDCSLQTLINRYNSDRDTVKKLRAVRKAVRDDADDWDFLPCLIEFRDIGEGLAQDFYREGGRDLNEELLRSQSPMLVFSNSRLSEPSRPISAWSDGIYLPFVSKHFTFHYYLSYPFLFYHEYASHVYAPEIDDRRFEDGWMMYAICLFLKNRWPELCKRYSLICAQRNVERFWLPRFGRLAQKGHEIAEDVDTWLGDNDRFLQITRDLASYPSDYAGHLSFHDDFLNLIKRFTQRDRGHLLRSAAETSTSALQLYENLKVVS
jgi:hypothetical protein